MQAPTLTQADVARLQLYDWPGNVRELQNVIERAVILSKGVRLRLDIALAGVAAVSPIFEISECVRALERPDNVLYEWNFVKDLKRRMRRKNRTHPGAFDIDKLSAVKSVRDFDRLFTAPYFGFGDEEDYYHRASAMRIVDRIRVPSLIIAADDDPFVPSAPFHDRRLRSNPAITTIVTPPDRSSASS